MLVSLAALVASGYPLAASTHSSDIDGVIKNLDLTSFRNSVGPRRTHGKTTFADYGFIQVEKADTGANLISQDMGWVMGFSIVSADPRSLRLCFYDRGLAKPGHATPSYNATSALIVSKKSNGGWTAKQVPAGFANCRNNPASA